MRAAGFRVPPVQWLVRGIRTQVIRSLPRRGATIPEELTSTRVTLPLLEEDLQHVSKQEYREAKSLKNAKGSYSKKSKSKLLNEEKAKKTLQPIPEPVTEETQFQRVAQTVTPLCEVPYFKQLKIKEKQVKKILQSLSKRLLSVRAPVENNIKKGLPCFLEPTRPSPELIAYRNKDEFGIHFGVDGNPKTVGFFIGRPVDSSMVCVPPTYLINMKDSHKHIAQSFQNFIRQSPHEACHRFDIGGTWRNLMVRSTENGEKMAIVFIHPQQTPEEGIQEIMEDLRKYFFEGEGSNCELDSLYLQACPHTRGTREQSPYRLIAGKEHITETCHDLSFQISPDSFFQVNTRGAEVLYSTVMEIAEVSPITTLLDICCGTGTVSMVMAPHVRGTIGIEVVSGAVEDARKNAVQNDIENSIFVAGKAEKVLPQLIKDLKECSDVIAVVNPARAGVHPDVIRAIRQCEAINKLIYVSCKPEGFAMENFVKLGSTRSSKIDKKKQSLPFVPKYAVPVDMFPHTNHTELVLLFERVEASA